MPSVQRNAKIYGAVETETNMSFTGFCKKIYNTTQQKIEIFIDDKKIDSILANKKITEIEEKYEVFDTDGFCFTYKLPKEYISEKHKLEFKTINGDQLVHSPVITLDTNDEKYNESSFIESLNEPIDKDKFKDMYCPNSIGFLATEENLEDKEFVNYIKELMIRFPNVEFKIFYFTENVKQLSKNLFSNKQIKYILPENIYDVASNIEVYLSNAKSLLDSKLFYKLRINIKYLYCVWINPDIQKTSIQKYELNIKSVLDQFMNQYKELGFFDHEISKDNSYTKSFQYAISTRFMLGEKTIDINKSAYEYFNFKLIEYALGNTLYKEFFYYQVLGQYKILYGEKN